MELNRGPWKDRQEAGRELGKAVRATITGAIDPASGPPPPPDRTQVPLVLGLPRGGVVVAAEVADVTGGELDVLVVRKAGVPWHRELAIGAVTASGIRVENPEVVERAGLRDEDLDAAFRDAEQEARVREQDLREGRAAPHVADRTIIVVDDGVATGATALAAAQLLKQTRPAPERVVLAVPVAPPDTARRLADHVDDLVVLAQPELFAAVGEWFVDFRQVSDDHVRALLAGHRQ
ncbi:phosphoribosyltransferase [Actinobacteria bacterium YIM 96077]|uniref:Phosphoribosyltransferase n=1 Tax=Phytoactinopolyspora halophila TaxID=1981511 RepID=A0A329QCX7_9ACTN|nr:phosphoribosyltransferase family protein [Phytoactinopolyspora halophila]AYY11840.1 phosphoribosyltransferase [Actinobacteria bacterium YIM 96077]RAW09861.1 phosphoribosyltransferase [Phytoactinopolyspora halophila]